MSAFNPFNWYWAIAGSQTEVISSASGGYVPVTDAAFLAWKAAGNTPPAFASEAELLDYLDQRALPIVFTTPAGLAAYAASARYVKESASVTVDSHSYATDRDSRGNYTGAVLAAQLNPAATFNWKTSAGSFVTLNATQITTVAVAVMTYVQTVYTLEKTVLDGINSSPPTITSKAQIDTAFAAL